MSDLEARESQGKNKALSQLSLAISAGLERQQSVINTAYGRSIIDRLVYPNDTYLDPLKGKVSIGYKQHVDANLYPVSNHALNQICKVLSIPKPYVNNLLDSCAGMKEEARLGLLHEIFSTHLREGVYLDRSRKPAKFLHRIMNRQLCGFLSRNFNRLLGTGQMLRPFIEECHQRGARPVEAVVDDFKMNVKCVVPIIYEPVDGEFVAFGATYSNSDFGLGSLVVSGTILRISSGTTSVLDDQLRKIHLGALIQESDIELSEETMKHESKAHSGAVRDMVANVFKEDNIEKMLNLIRFAHEHHVSWEKLRSRAKEILNKAELDALNELLGKTKDGTVDLPPVSLNNDGDPEANAWWASAALGYIATSVQDVEKKVAIQELAGSLLGK